MKADVYGSAERILRRAVKRGHHGYAYRLWSDALLRWNHATWLAQG